MRMVVKWGGKSYLCLDATEEETEEAPDHGEGFHVGEPQGGPSGGHCPAREADRIPYGPPRIQESV